MDADFILVLGVCVFAAGFPMVIGAFSGARSTLPGIGAMVAGAALMLYATISSPGVYSVDEVPDVFIRVIADLIN